MFDAIFVVPRTTRESAIPSPTPHAEQTTEQDRQSVDATEVIVKPRIGRYVIIRELGAGGMGRVYEAYDPDLGRRVAIKVLLSSATHGVDSSQNKQLRARLIREAKSLARLSHPNIVPVFDVGIFEDDAIFVAMEFVAGRTLREVLESGSTTWREGLELVLQAAEGLAAAHAAGFLHRDFKPDNLLVGDDGLVRVLDFGLAKHASLAESGDQTERQTNGPSQEATDPLDPAAEEHASSALTPNEARARPSEHVGQSTDSSVSIDPTSFGTVLGTQRYMPPEQLLGMATDGNSDLFALSCILFEVLCGTPAFPTHPLEARLEAIRNATFKWPTRIPNWLQKTVARGLAYESSNRGPGVSACVLEIRHRLAREGRRRNATKWALATSLALGIGAAWYLAPNAPVDLDCSDPSPLVEQIWNADTLEKVAKGFASTGEPLADELWRRSSQGLDQWRQRWTQAAAHLCPANRIALQLTPFEGTLQDQSRACLNESRAEVETLLQIWRTPTSAQVLNSESALRSLSSPEECIDPALLRGRIALPKDPVRRALVLAQLETVKRALIRIQQAEYSQATEMLRALEKQRTNHLELGVESAIASAFSYLARMQEGKLEDQTAPTAELWFGPSPLIVQILNSMLSRVSGTHAFTLQILSRNTMN
jgi:serine/threonine protein kinase